MVVTPLTCREYPVYVESAFCVLRLFLSGLFELITVQLF